MKENNVIGLKGFNLIQFGGRSFFIPLQFHSTVYVSHDGNKLDIDFEGGEGTYCLVNGIRCGCMVSYIKDKDIVSTFINEYTMDGVPFFKNEGIVSTMDGVQCTSPIPVEFKFDDWEFVYGGKKVIPQRHYDELASTFLSENPQLDSRIQDFLQKYPECFGNGSERGYFPPNYVNEWIRLHESLIQFETDEEYREHVGEYVNLRHVTHLEDDVFQLFKEEELGE